ncbi:synaptic vesicle glycoprotein 2C-like [Cydia splendana]|uniref:synaptic vesicle glycoprotein 2C-like n=1 Tax=Cydia splendana TaxID=1100963 RepID=UPI00300C09E9
MTGHDKILKVPFEEALDSTGVGAYQYRCVGLSSAAALAYACVCYGGAILVPAGACELRAAPQHQAAMLAAPALAGVVGSVVWGWLGDRRGRRRALLGTLGGAALTNAAASLAPSWPLLLLLQCTSTFLGSGVYPLVMTLLSESVPRASRDRALLAVATVMLCSQGVMAGLAIPIVPLTFSYYVPALGIYWNSWRTLMLAYSLPAIVAGLGIWLFVQESPKFVLTKGDEDGAMKIMELIHKINKVDEKFQVQGLFLDSQEKTMSMAEAEAEAEAGAGAAAGRGRFTALFRAPLRQYTAICTLLFIGMQFVGAFLIWLPKISNQLTKLLQTGEGSDMTLCAIIERSLHAETRALAEPAASGVSCSINVSALLILLAACSLQLIANGVLSLAVGRYGRLNSVMGLVLVCGSSGALAAAGPPAAVGVALYAGLVVGIIVVGPYTAIAVSLFPTHLRSLAVGLTITGGRLCGFFTIQLANYLLGRHCRLGLLLFSAVFASSALLLRLLPSDRRPRLTHEPADPGGVALTPLNKSTTV